MSSKGTMLILKGIKSLLHQEPAIDYALREGYTPEVLDASGETGEHSAQTNLAIARIEKGGITALYGFSGGGYNCLHIWKRLVAREKEAIKEVVIIGSPGVAADFFSPPCPKVTIYNKKGVEHMEQPASFLASRPPIDRTVV